MELRVDPLFRDKIRPLSGEEFKQLEENIVADGEVREPIVVWQGVIVDGHHRWQIIQKHPMIPYKVKEMDFADKYAAIVWMCRNQVGRRNLTDDQKMALIGEAYAAQKKTQGAADGFRGNQYAEVVKDHSDLLPKNSPTAAKIGKQFGVAEPTVKRAEQFLKGLDAAEEVSPGFKEAVLSGEIKAPRSRIAEIRRMPEKEKAAEVEAIREGKKVSKPRYDREKVAENKELASKIDTLDRQMAGCGGIERTLDSVLDELNVLEDEFLSRLRSVNEKRKEIIERDERGKAALEGFMDSLIHDIELLKEEIL